MQLHSPVMFVEAYQFSLFAHISSRCGDVIVTFSGLHYNTDRQTEEWQGRQLESVLPHHGWDRHHGSGHF